MRTPALVPRLRPFTSTIFAEMTALATRTGAVNLGQGFPDTDGPAGCSTPPRAAIARRASTSTRPAPASRNCGGDRRTPHARYGLRLRPGHAGAGHRRRHRGDRRRRCSPWSSRATRCCVIEPYYDSYAAVGGAGRRDPHGGVAASRTDGALRPRRRRAARPRSRQRTRRSCSTRRTTRPAPCSPAPELAGSRRGSALEHDLIAITDEVYEHLVFDGREHVPLSPPARHARPDTDHLQRGQDVQRAPAGRSAGCAAPTRTGRRPCARPSSS